MHDFVEKLLLFSLTAYWSGGIELSTNVQRNRSVRQWDTEKNLVGIFIGHKMHDENRSKSKNSTWNAYYNSMIQQFPLSMCVLIHNYATFFLLVGCIRIHIKERKKTIFDRNSVYNTNILRHRSTISWSGYFHLCFPLFHIEHKLLDDVF